METFIKEAAYFVALIGESIAILVILLGVVKTAAYFFKTPLFSLKFQEKDFLTFRRDLGSYLSLSLEFLIGADILKTAISPNWNEIGMLGSIVVIRTVLNYFLTLEMRSHFEKADNK